jgi:hypothetical protein
MNSPFVGYALLCAGLIIRRVGNDPDLPWGWRIVIQVVGSVFLCMFCVWIKRT